MLVRLNEVEEQVKTRIKAPPPEAIENVAANALRLSATSLVYALAFAIAAQRRGQEVPLLIEMLTIWSLHRQSRPSRRSTAGTLEEDYLAQLVPPEDDPPPSA
jgi:hypothetical protein